MQPDLITVHPAHLAPPPLAAPEPGTREPAGGLPLAPRRHDRPVRDGHAGAEREEAGGQLGALRVVARDEGEEALWRCRVWVQCYYAF